MKSIQLGNTEIYVSKVGYGCMGLSHAFGTPLTEEEAIQKIHAAYNAGYRYFDTAECYTGIDETGNIVYNEEVVGKGIKDFRKDIILATKFGVKMTATELLTDSSPETIRKSLEGSLKRLGTDYVDLYYQHRIDPNVEPEVVAGVMKELIEEGKIRAWGISELEDEEYLRRANAVCPVAAVQNMYSLIDRYTESLFPVFEELGITMFAYTPLAKGFLSGVYKEKPTFKDSQDFRGGRLQFSEGGFDYYNQAIDLIRQLADEKKATLAQISLAWMMNKTTKIIPIPGTRTESRMIENANASEVVLTPEEVKAIDDALNKLNLTDTASQWRGY